jgi:hypothetical protein
MDAAKVVDRVILVTWALALLAGCSSSSTPQASRVSPMPEERGETTDTTATPLASGLEPRPHLPPLKDGEAAACVPGCGLTAKVSPGELPGGKYQTQWFFGGYMTLSTGGGWFNLDDSTGELKLIPPGGGDYGVGFALDLYPVRGEKGVKPVPETVKRWIAWYRRNPSLLVSRPTKARVGDIMATRIDLTTAATAKNDDPECPATRCVNVWGFPQWDHFGGIAGNDVYRQYLADVLYSGSRHVFFVTVEARDEADIAAVTPRIEALLMTVTLPVSEAD